jgi:LysR family glycine cleavage system transcriptional activator
MTTSEMTRRPAHDGEDDGRLAAPGEEVGATPAAEVDASAAEGRGRDVSLRRLPPLTALKTFEAVGRVGMAGAAVELNVTAAAINHQLRALEADLGLRLFTRTTSGLVLNKAGREYLGSVAASFDMLFGATRRIKNPFRAHRLVVECLTSFANDFVIPHLPAFCRDYPDVELEFRTIRRPRARLDLSHTGAHVAITGGNVAGEWPNFNAERLSYETFFPVCSPALLQGPNPLRRPADLAHHTLLTVAPAIEGWPDWLAAARAAGEDVTGVSLAHAVRFDNFHSSSLAARLGIGVDLGRAPLVDKAIAAGELVAPFDIRIRSNASYWLVFSDATAEIPAFQLFRDWLIGELDPIDSQ